MNNFKKTTIFDLINKHCYNPLFVEVTDPEQALFIMAMHGNFTAQKAYLQMSDPATWNEKSREYKKRIAKEEAIPMFISINELLTKEELNEYRELNENEQQEYINRKWRERNQ